ncbi:MAG TPA: hypothetical protein DCZ71_04755, partial [Ruminococcus sp.]|nr:hypothetical protein [Ruminococcus sp.]
EAETEEDKDDKSDLSINIENGTADVDFDEDALSDFMGVIEAPEFNPKADAAEEEFIGKWEAECIVAEGTAYSSIFGIPVSAMVRFEIEAGGTGKILTDAGEDEDAEEATTFSWTYGDGKLHAVFTADEDGETDEPADIYISDGKMVMVQTEDGEESQVFLKKVDEFTKFDWEEFYNSIGLSEDEVAETEKDLLPE